MRTIGKYGIDAPYVPLLFFLIGTGAMFIGFPSIRQGDVWAYVFVAYGVLLLLSCVVYLHMTLRGKFIIWNELFARHPVRPDATVLDLGCGRGAVLLMAAKRLADEGKAVGIDLWQRRDQSGNDMDVARRNATMEGVADKVHFQTGDMMQLPFEDDSFDYVTASFSIHNIKSKAGRSEAVNEACRVLRTDGDLIIADIRATKEYVDTLHSLGMKNVRSYNAGIKGWWGGPWMPTYIVVAQK